jgi:hypothetical protein
MPQHPEPHVRCAVRILAMVGELHKRGHQRLRVMPYMSPSGMHWRCSIAPVLFFHRNHGAILGEPGDADATQAAAMIARYSSADGNHYFDWNDATADTARSLADKFLARFLLLAAAGRGWDYAYAGWYLRLLGYAERGWLPYVFADYESTSFERVHLQDIRPEECKPSAEEPPVLPLPPPGLLQQDYG